MQLNSDNSHPNAHPFGGELHAARILIVDDQPANSALLEMILEEDGFTNITSVADPREAVALYAQAPFEAVLLDYNMPYMNGVEVIEELKGMHNEAYLPILMITAHTDKKIRYAALNSGAQDFLTKPFDSMEVIPRIKNLIALRMFNHQLEAMVEVRTAQLLQTNKELAQTNQKLEVTKLEIIRRLGRAAEYRDNETGHHVVRVGKYSSAIGVAMGLTIAQCELLERAAPMHDVGKIGVSDIILLKPGKLTKDEFDIIKTHCDIGATILGGYDEEPLISAREIALTHHEKWNGTGYPNGLQGNDIPLAGRICAVADVFRCIDFGAALQESLEPGRCISRN